MYTRQVENLKRRLGQKRVSWWTENLKRRSMQKLGIKAYDYVPFLVNFIQVQGTEQANHFHPTAGDEMLEDIMTVVDLKSIGLLPHSFLFVFDNFLLLGFLSPCTQIACL